MRLRLKFVNAQILVAAIALVISAVASADTPPTFVPTIQAAEEADHYDAGMRSTETAQTDLQAAEELPLENLTRAEALELLRRTFGMQIEAPASLFGDLEVDRFLSDNVALVETDGKPALLDSTLPLRAPDLLGREEQVDLGLERAEGEILPTNPLTETGIPDQLGEGIELPGADIQIELVGAPEDRTASIVEGAAAVYPNVAEDTDFAVAPTPSGVETFAQIRSPQAPMAQTLRFTLPEGASLQASGEGGAEVLAGDGEALAGIHPPSAIDAAGVEVPVSADVTGDTITYTAESGPDAVYPLLLDPVIEEYNWGNGNQTHIGDWKLESYIPMLAKTKAECETWCAGYLAPNSQGLWIADYKEWKNPASGVAGFRYNVPRWLSDWTNFGVGPTSYISHATYYALSFQHRTDSGFSPQLLGGLAQPELGSFYTAFTRNGNEPNLSLDSQPYQMTGSTKSKEAQFVLVSSEARQLTANRDAWMGWATLELTDPDHPNAGESVATPGWVNGSPTAKLPFTFTDKGLGVSAITVKDSAGHSWQTSIGCTGAVSNPCPRTWTSESVSQPALKYDPSVLPQGANILELVATDPLGHTNTVALPEQPATLASTELRVDHTAPTVALSGSLTEQATLGTTLPQYKLKYLAKDGTTAAPQSGAAGVEVKIDGAKVTAASQSPGCATKNCEISGEWTLEAGAYSVGEHTLTVTATDGVGMASAPATLKFKVAKDTTAPALSAPTAFYTAPEGWVEQKSYSYMASATDPGGYGLTSVTLKIDGKTVKAVSQSCVAGGCPQSLNGSINMATYAGGEHPAELIATDGAGNVAKKAWTVNVDPKGSVPLSEAEATLEALEETTEATPIAPTDEMLDPAEIEDGNNPGLAVGAGGQSYVSTGSPTPVVIEKSAGEGFSVEGLGEEVALHPEESEKFEIEPISGMGGTGTIVAEESAALAPNTASGVDTILRPKYDGAQTFQAIREPSSPTSFSWRVNMSEGQTMVSLDAESVAVYYESGALAMTIFAEAAHDAAGKAVATELKVSEGNVLTLVVKHQVGGVTYPVMAGAAWQVGFVPVFDPNPHTEEMVGTARFGPVVYLPMDETDDTGATASSNPYYRPRKRGFEFTIGLGGGCGAYCMKLNGIWEFNMKFAWWKESKPHPSCPNEAPLATYELGYCNWTGLNHQPYRDGYHITALNRTNWHPFGSPGTLSEHLAAYLYGDGYGNFHDTDCICNPLPIH